MNRLLLWLLFVLVTVATMPTSAQPIDRTIAVGSKAFTESVVLGEMARQLIASAGVPAVHRAELGGTRIAWEALLRGEIDVYPEYTGTLRAEIFADRGLPDDAALRKALAEQGITMSRPLGFSNTYVLGMPREMAGKLGIRRISELRAHPDLRLRFSNEFMDRQDGWPGLRQHYQLPHADVQGMDHRLAYRGLDAGVIDVIDLYATDAEIRAYDIEPLEDDLAFFPPYDAVLLYRTELKDEAPEAVAALQRLAGQIDEETMISLNARARLDRVPAARVSADFLHERFGLAIEVEEQTVAGRIGRRTMEHLFMVGVSLLAAIAVAVPLGIVSARRPVTGQAILSVAGVLQTIPALALLALLIPLLGKVGTAPAILALFLYSLLPIVRNTYTGLRGVAPELRESAAALGLPGGAQLRLVELPLAAPTILAGIKTAAIINVGFATLGALVGAGGYGQPIVTGLRLADGGLILEGAIPAALLALAVQGVFELIERRIVPRGMRETGKADSPG